jgi:hypothetical protein
VIRSTICVALVFALLSAAMAGQADAHSFQAGAHSVLSVTPAKATIGRQVTISGRHLRPNTFYTLLLAVPNAQKPRVRAFFGGLGRTNPSGTFSVRTTMPVVVECGPAVVVALAAKVSTSVTAHVTLTGCRARGSLQAPPPPPGGNKKSKHRKP